MFRRRFSSGLLLHTGLRVARYSWNHFLALPITSLTQPARTLIVRSHWHKHSFVDSEPDNRRQAGLVSKASLTYHPIDLGILGAATDTGRFCVHA
jgi:hypothetical protein